MIHVSLHSVGLCVVQFRWTEDTYRSTLSTTCSFRSSYTSRSLKKKIHNYSSGPLKKYLVHGVYFEVLILTTGPGAPDGPWGPGAPPSPFCPASPTSPLAPGWPSAPWTDQTQQGRWQNINKLMWKRSILLCLNWIYCGDFTYRRTSKASRTRRTNLTTVTLQRDTRDGQLRKTRIHSGENFYHLFLFYIFTGQHIHHLLKWNKEKAEGNYELEAFQEKQSLNIVLFLLYIKEQISLPPQHITYSRHILLRISKL